MADKKNISRGADKAEKLTTSSRGKGNKEKSAAATKGDAVKKSKTKKSTAAKTTKPIKGTTATRDEKKKLREEKKLAKKQLAAERAERRHENKIARKERAAERRAAAKEKRIERKEKRAERRDMLKHESREARRKRIIKEREKRREEKRARREEKFAERQQKRENAMKKRAEKRAARAEKKHAPGFGGWLAAVISLGVTCLALGTVLTFGWLNMNDMQATMAGGYTESLYEFNSVVDDLDVSLAKASMSSSTSDRARNLTDIATESESAEIILERMPVGAQSVEKLTSFINSMGNSAKRMLYTVAQGGELSEEDINLLNALYETNSQIKEEINALTYKSGGDDMLAAMRGKGCALSDCFDRIQNEILAETPAMFGMRARRLPPMPRTAALVEGEEEISASDAEELCKEYFSSYKVSEAHCTGETAGAFLSLYNVNLSTAYGQMLVQLTKQGGKPVLFDSFKDCSEHNFSVENCIYLAKDFLQNLGYDDVEAVWVSENGTTCDLHFAPEQSGVIIYPDMIKVKVCEERGIVTGMEAVAYVMNHTQREELTPSISESSAKASINGKLDVTSSRLAVVNAYGGERLCYEFFGETNGRNYYAYVDAATGEELDVKTVVTTAQGNAIR